MTSGSELTGQLQAIHEQLLGVQQALSGMAVVIEELRCGRQPHDPLLAASDIWVYLGRGRSWFYEARKNGTIPPPDRVLGGRGGERWHRSSIDRAMTARANGGAHHGC